MTTPPAEAPFVSRGRGRPDRPNLIFILADDLGWADLGCYGSTAIATPHLDRLAAEGIRFTDAYAASSWCSPTRIGLYTGRSPGRLAAGLAEPLRSRDETSGIPTDHPTLPSLLVEAGYDTAMFGKWHCGWLPWFSPLRIGFQTFFGNLDGAMDYFEHIDTLGDPDLWEGETPVEMTGYYTDLISERAAQWISAERDRPFYLQLNYTAPHWPWEGRGDAEVGAAIRRDFETGELASPLLHWDAGSLAKYGELVEAMDDGIGVVLDAVAAAGLTDDTMIVFCSDNGGERWSKNWPFVGEKGDLTEGGIRVPLLLRWPAAVSALQVSDAPNITMDWTATMLDAAGAGPHPDYPLDGVSLLPWLVDGVDYPEHDLAWRVASQGALRRGRFKYLRDGRGRARLGNWPLRPEQRQGFYDLLYDLSVDGREMANVARHHPDVLAELRAAWEAFDADLLPYPDDHPHLPHHAEGGRRAGNGLPAQSAPD